MKHLARRVVLPMLSLSLIAGISGCNSKTETDAEAKSAESEPAAHSHPSAGPHDGPLVELGNEEYHAELVLPGSDDYEPALTIYILDGSATKTVAIDAASITVNLVHDGEPQQYELAAAPEDGDAEGTSSRFRSEAQELVTHFKEDVIHGKLVLSIEGKSYRGQIDVHKDGSTHSHSHP